MTATTEDLSAALRRVRDVHPETISVSFSVRASRDGELRYHTSSTNEDDLGGGIVLGYGDTLEASLSALCDRLRELCDARRALAQCCVEGCSDEAVATTGEGPMCRQHALAWLQGEKEDSEAQQNVDMG